MGAVHKSYVFDKPRVAAGTWEVFDLFGRGVIGPTSIADAWEGKTC
jgi:hypothetical protein